MQLTVMPVSVETVLPLRRRVLRADTPDAPPDFPEDRLPTTLHLAAFPKSTSGGDVDFREPVAVATFFPAAWEDRHDAWQLRGMAVAPEAQGTGIGAVLLAEGVRRAREAGATLLWANGRDSAVGFYERQGWKVVGEGFEYGPARLPHHVVILDLA